MIGTENNERRDWTLLIFIIPIGILLIILVGQLAVRLVPSWSVNADMNSNLEPDTASARPLALLEPILPQILTPMAWAKTYLTPGAEISFPPFLTFEPTATPSPTPAAPTNDSGSPTPVPSETSSPTSTSGSGTPPATGTSSGTEPPDAGGGSSTPPPTCTDLAANNQGQSLPCTFDPAPVCTDSGANNQGLPLPCTYDPPVCPGAHNPDGPLPCDYGNISTIDPLVYSYVTTTPAIGVGTPDNTDLFDDKNISDIKEGKYTVVVLSVEVKDPPDNNYDLVYYEFNNNGYVNLDWIIIGISHLLDGSQYYEVFNWGDGTPDTNSNVGVIAIAVGAEDDDEHIPIAGNQEVPPSPTNLYDPDYVPPPTESNGPLPQTGILIDVDKAKSDPPPGIYEYIVIISPLNGTSDDEAQVDAIQTVEIPTP